MKTPYVLFKQKVKNAQSFSHLNQLEKNLDILWNAGVFTISEFKRLDSYIVDCYIAIGDKND